MLALLLGHVNGRAEIVSIVIASNAAPRVVFGAGKIAEVIKSAKMEATIVRYDARKLSAVLTGNASDKAAEKKIYVAQLKTGGARESFILGQMMVGDDLTVMGKNSVGPGHLKKRRR